MKTLFFIPVALASAASVSSHSSSSSTKVLKPESLIEKLVARKHGNERGPVSAAELQSVLNGLRDDLAHSNYAGDTTEVDKLRENGVHLGNGRVGKIKGAFFDKESLLQKKENNMALATTETFATTPFADRDSSTLCENPLQSRCCFFCDRIAPNIHSGIGEMRTIDMLDSQGFPYFVGVKNIAGSKTPTDELERIGDALPSDAKCWGYWQQMCQATDFAFKDYWYSQAALEQHKLLMQMACDPVLKGDVELLDPNAEVECPGEESERGIGSTCTTACKPGWKVKSDTAPTEYVCEGMLRSTSFSASMEIGYAGGSIECVPDGSCATSQLLDWVHKDGNPYQIKHADGVLLENETCTDPADPSTCTTSFTLADAYNEDKTMGVRLRYDDQFPVNCGPGYAPAYMVDEASTTNGVPSTITWSVTTDTTNAYTTATDTVTADHPGSAHAQGSAPALGDHSPVGYEGNMADDGITGNHNCTQLVGTVTCQRGRMETLIISKETKSFNCVPLRCDADMVAAGECEARSSPAHAGGTGHYDFCGDAISLANGGTMDNDNTIATRHPCCPGHVEAHGTNPDLTYSHMLPDTRGGFNGDYEKDDEEDDWDEDDDEESHEFQKKPRGSRKRHNKSRRNDDDEEDEDEDEEFDSYDEDEDDEAEEEARASSLAHRRGKKKQPKKARVYTHEELYGKPKQKAQRVEVGDDGDFDKVDDDDEDADSSYLRRTNGDNAGDVDGDASDSAADGASGDDDASSFVETRRRSGHRVGQRTRPRNAAKGSAMQSSGKGAAQIPRVAKNAEDDVNFDDDDLDDEDDSNPMGGSSFLQMGEHAGVGGVGDSNDIQLPRKLEVANYMCKLKCGIVNSLSKQFDEEVSAMKTAQVDSGSFDENAELIPEGWNEAPTCPLVEYRWFHLVNTWIYMSEALSVAVGEYVNADTSPNTDSFDAHEFLDHTMLYVDVQQTTDSVPQGGATGTPAKCNAAAGGDAAECGARGDQQAACENGDGKCTFSPAVAAGGGQVEQMKLRDFLWHSLRQGIKDGKPSDLTDTIGDADNTSCEQAYTVGEGQSWIRQDPNMERAHGKEPSCGAKCCGSGMNQVACTADEICIAKEVCMAQEWVTTVVDGACSADATYDVSALGRADLTKIKAEWECSTPDQKAGDWSSNCGYQGPGCSGGA